MKAFIDLHTHTLSSGHGFSTLKENIEEAARKGLLVLGTSDHSVRMPGSAHRFFFENYKVIREEILGVKILSGIEGNIYDYEGNIDIEPSMMKNLDYIIASLHSHCIESGTVQENTRTIIGAMKNPYVKIIGHPDDSRFPLDYDNVAYHAKKYQVALELNNSSLLPNSVRKDCRENARSLLEKAKEYEVYIILGSDSHIYYDVGRFDEAYELLTEANFPEELIINNDLEKLSYVLIE
ncbi:phosphatase [Geosporobacter ferrireducens]|uniref:phosphatase n=1 Tax=Geosporobacter ferrireducens TaxID=1424294 RepID=UPI00139E279A|nr:phosphatase [Geosporobacter ferrireducens]MTI57600.1 phosphatase [Geosporobacter ferrireducens]